MPRHSADARMTAYSSDSPELLATVDSVFEYVLTKCAPNRTVPPDVDLGTLRHPTQLASDVMLTISTGNCQRYFHTSLG